MAEKYELIVFDWDGTLIDSEKNIVLCMQAALSDIGAIQPEPEAISNIIGLGLAEAIESLCPELSLDDAALLVDRYRYHFLSSEPSVPFPGVTDTLKFLADQEYYLAVATGKGKAGLNKAMETTGYKQFFHVTRCADETRSKPHPQMLLEIMEFLSVEPQNTLMIGDTVYDLDMANNAGVDSAAVSYGVHEWKQLQPYGPKAYFDQLGELLQWLEKEIK